ncbi:MAG: hypothetical protein HYW86_05245 [Candidatus Roizmanbacteria bacterium]|nr:MAG: hypothetical protein HYW86_05245 [Candidatus Roizmanbacteria bacterium]
MVKKIAIISLIGIVIFLFSNFLQKEGKKSSSNVTPVSRTVPTTFSTPEVDRKVERLSTSIFVPYWADFKTSLSVENYDRVIYFGVAPDLDGYSKEEVGYQKLEEFSLQTEGVEKLLTVRLLNSDINITLLKKKNYWPKIIDETLKIAKNYKFNGIALDLEINGLPVIDISGEINDFVKSFYTASRANNLNLTVILYGDVFFRKRPYDVSALAATSDEIMIMAYDFHKSRGEPGPNFPLKGKEKYGYDYETLIEDFSVVPQNKLSIIFGMYGYDWVVDEKKRPIKPAKSLTDLEIKKEFLDSCKWKNCVVMTNDLSSEKEVDYVDEDEQYHIVWFEDESSVEKKIEYLKGKGIGSYVYWAYGYF